MKTKVSGRKEIKIKIEVNKIETKKTIGKIWFPEKKIDITN